VRPAQVRAGQVPIAPRWSPPAPCALFLWGDLAVLVLVGVVATLAMHCTHRLGWPFVATTVLGMVAAMIAQMLLAFAVSPLLGSIESMVPSMVVGMTSPMVVCTLHLLGCESTWPMALAIGTIFGAGTQLYVRLYGRACRHRFARDAARMEK